MQSTPFFFNPYLCYKVENTSTFNRLFQESSLGNVHVIPNSGFPI